MDVLTPAGQESLKREAKAVDIWHRHHSEYRYIHTPKHLPALVDAVLVRDDELAAIVETKCRNIPYEKLVTSYQNEWLITARKIDEAAEIARQLKVPLVGFLYLDPDKMLLVKRLIDESGNFCCKHRRDTFQTRATINGGTAVRENLLIDMSECLILL